MVLGEALVATGGLLALAAAATAAGAGRPRVRRVTGVLAAAAAAGAAFLAASEPLARWIRWGEVPFSWTDSMTLLLAGLCAAAAFLLLPRLRSGGEPEEATPRLASGAGTALLGILVAAFLLRADDSPIFATPATMSPFAALFHGLHPFASGFLLATVVPASGLLLSPSGRARPAPWTGVLRRVLQVGVPVLLAALVAESVWHGDAWGSPWSFDLAETWPILSALIFVLWFHLRSAAPRRHRAAAGLLLAGSLVHVGFWIYCPLLPTAIQSNCWHW